MDFMIDTSAYSERYALGYEILPARLGRDFNKLESYGRGDRIRTCDPLVPNQMRYQAAPLPEPALPLGQASGEHNPIVATGGVVAIHLTVTGQQLRSFPRHGPSLVLPAMRSTPCTDASC